MRETVKTSECLMETRAGSGGAGHSVVEIDALVSDADFCQALLLGEAVLLVGGAAGMSRCSWRSWRVAYV